MKLNKNNFFLISNLKTAQMKKNPYNQILKDFLFYQYYLICRSGTYSHYLHHKYFECNYAGDTMNFLDKFFGTFHDGSEEATAKVMERLKRKSYLKS